MFKLKIPVIELEGTDFGIINFDWSAKSRG